MKKKKVYCLKTRETDNDDWGNTGYFSNKKDRDEAASLHRIIIGFRTFSFEEMVTPERFNEIFDL